MDLTREYDAPAITVQWFAGRRDGPLYVRGDVVLRSLDGTILRRDTRMAMCRCGLAAKMPLCDNSCRKAHWTEQSLAERVGNR